MKKTFVKLMAVTALAATVVPVFAVESTFVENNDAAAGVEFHNAEVAKQDAAKAAAEAEAKAAAEAAALKAGIVTSEYVGETTTTEAGYYGYKLADGTVVNLPVGPDNTVKLPTDAFIERQVANNPVVAAPAEAKTEAAAKAEATPAAPAAKVAHNSVAPAKTATTSKALPKTSAAQ